VNKILASVGVAAVALAMCGSVQAKPVVYTLRTVSDGQLGSLTLIQAAITITFSGDTRNVKTSVNSAGDIVYTNSQGEATVTVTMGGRTVKAKFAPGQIYVRYDTSYGAVGFGSAIAPTYPLTIGCGTVSCLAADDDRYGIVAALVDQSAGQLVDTISANVLALPANLSQPTILTGATSACAVAYDAAGICPAAAPTALATDHGGFYLQDQYFSSLVYYGGFSDCCGISDEEGNVGVFTVRLTDDD
jgi:hypothetical protein